MVVTALQVSAQSIEIKGVKYSVLKSDKTKVSALITKRVPAHLIIPERIEIKGKQYEVTKVEINRKDRIRSKDGHSVVWEFEPLISIKLPKTVLLVGFEFEYCRNLEYVVLPERTITIPPYLFCGCRKLKNVDIPNSVTSIGELAFDGTAIENIVVPNSVKFIGLMAFSDCEKLQYVKLPDSQFSTNKKYDTVELFQGSRNIEEIKGNTIKHPTYIIESLINDIENDAPFKKKIQFIRRSYTYFAEEKILDRMKQWQQRKEYETTAQWRDRVTVENQNAQLAKVTEEVRQEYIEKFKPKSLSGTLGTFDADYNTYPVTINGVENTVYAQVPLGEAQNFKVNWSNVKMQPQYGIVDDHVGVLSCTFTLNGKAYPSARNYSNDSRDDLAINLPPIELDLGGDIATQPSQQPTIAAIDNSIDTQIPTSSAHNNNTFAVVIGNENYQRVAKVEYAKNDAKTFAAYCQKTLGLPAKNIRAYNDATYGTMLSALKDIKSIADAYRGDLNIIFYYARHGVPDGTGKVYLLPVDADGTQTEVCLATTKLYKRLAELQARSVVVFMDACFSGAKRGEGMITAARGVALKAKSDVPEGNCVVFSAANGEETAFPYKEKGHGMFTYFLLKKLQETKGDATLGELGEYIQTNVQRQAAVVNRKPQTPTVVHSVNATNWNTMKLK